MAYRSAGRRPEPISHFYRSARARSDARFRIGLLAIWPALAGALFLGAALSEGIGFLSFFVIVVLIWSTANRFGDAAGMTLTVADGSLVVTRGRSRSVLFRTP